MSAIILDFFYSSPSSTKFTQHPFLWSEFGFPLHLMTDIICDWLLISHSSWVQLAANKVIYFGFAITVVNYSSAPGNLHQEERDWQLVGKVNKSHQLHFRETFVISSNFKFLHHIAHH